MSLFDRLPHVCTVYGPPTQARDDGGGTVTTWPTTRASSVPCLMVIASSSEKERFAQMGITCTHTLTLRTTGSGIQRGDKVTMTSPAEVSGITFHVTGIQTQPAVGNIPTFTRLQVEQQL